MPFWETSFLNLQEVASYVEWTGRVWRWIFFSHRFQLAFTFKNVFKALDHIYIPYISYSVTCTYGATHRLFVRTYLCPTSSVLTYYEAKTESVYSYSISSCISCVLNMIYSEAGVHLRPWRDLLIAWVVLFVKAICKFLFAVCAYLLSVPNINI